MTRREAVLLAESRLAEAGVATSREDAEWLLAEVLGCARPALWLDSQKPLTAEQVTRWESWLAARARRIPLQHLTGRAAFLDWVLQVSPAVLIPRPETEGLALRASEMLRGMERAEPGRTYRVLDFATGSGCLALALAARHPNAEVHGLDLSTAALEVARANAAQLGLASRIQWHPGDGFAALSASGHEGAREFDLIVSNPPYIPTAEIAALDPEVRDHDPRLALDGGVDGLDFYRRLARESQPWLAPRGWLLAEFGDGQGAAIGALFDGANWSSVTTEPDLSGRDRIVIAQRR